MKLRAEIEIENMADREAIERAVKLLRDIAVVLEKNIQIAPQQGAQP